MIHASKSPTSNADEVSTSCSSWRAQQQMSACLRTLALCLGGPFAGLTIGTRRRLAVACNGFAELIQAGNTASDQGIPAPSSTRFLLSALFELRSTEGALPLSEEEETWMVAEVEADFGEALALFESQLGRPRSPVPPRPLLPRSAS